MSTIKSVIAAYWRLHESDHAVRDARRSPVPREAIENAARKAQEEYTKEWQQLSEADRKYMGTVGAGRCPKC